MPGKKSNKKTKSVTPVAATVDLPEVLSFIVDNTIYFAARTFKLYDGMKCGKQFDDVPISTLVQMLGTNLVSVYVGHTSKLNEYGLTLTNTGNVDFYVLKSDITNTNGLPVHTQKVDDTEFKILIVKYDQYKSIFTKFAADPKAAMFTNAEKGYFIESTTVARKVNKKIVVNDIDFEYLKELAESCIPREETPKPKTVTAVNPWNKQTTTIVPTIVSPVPTIVSQVAVAKSPKQVIPDIKTLYEFLESFGIKPVDLENSNDDEEIRERLIESISRTDGTLTLYNDKVRITLWNPCSCPKGVCPKLGTKHGCGNISCSRHTDEEMINKCKTTLDDKSNPFTARVRPLIAAQLFLFQKNIKDVDFICKALEYSIDCLTDKNIKCLSPLYARAY
jgi:hypothetical protein